MSDDKERKMTVNALDRTKALERAFRGLSTFSQGLVVAGVDLTSVETISDNKGCRFRIEGEEGRKLEWWVDFSGPEVLCCIALTIGSIKTFDLVGVTLVSKEETLELQKTPSITHSPHPFFRAFQLEGVHTSRPILSGGERTSLVTQMARGFLDGVLPEET